MKPRLVPTLAPDSSLLRAELGRWAQAGLAASETCGLQEQSWLIGSPAIGPAIARPKRTVANAGLGASAEAGAFERLQGGQMAKPA
jgi:hypothetical protein